MASEQVTTTAPPIIGGSLPETTTLPEHPARSKSLKRGRQDQSLGSPSLLSANLRSSPPLKSPRFATNLSPAPLTGAAALADARNRREAEKMQSTAQSENPNLKVLSSLLGMSKPQDAPGATNTLSRGMLAAANAITIPSPMQFEDRSETSPASVTSLASLSSTAPTATANSTVVASPTTVAGTIDVELRPMPMLEGSNEERSNRAQTYSGSMIAQHEASRAPPRGLSLPMSNLSQQGALRSPSQKKHKCPYCDTEFTRHHNLKSHLLTHSQEKPYVCKTCNMRFRRLHDLKRHTKLHTGERPHICPKCDRKFARGDALARHSKGQGGCAGRRASMGSFGGEDGEFDESHGTDGGMDRVMYDGPPNEERDMSEDDRRRLSLPSIKAQHVNDNQGGLPREEYEVRSRGPSTYPPAGPRPIQSSGGLYPPHNDRGGSSGSTSPSLQSGMPNGHTPTHSMSSSVVISPGGSMFSHGGMTESPKPLSPGGMHTHQIGHDNSMISRQRSPSLTAQFQQQQFGRRQQSGRSPPPTGIISLPSPQVSGHGPKLPSLQGLAPPESRFTLPSQVMAQQHGNSAASSGGPPGQGMRPGNTTNSIFQPGPPVGGRGGSGPQHQSSSSGDSSNNMFASETGVWTYVQTLEEKTRLLTERVSALERIERNQGEKINRLTDEVNSLRNQLQHQQHQ